MHAAALRYLREVARCGSVRRAAQTLNVASSAVNRQILKLESELGVRLFDRLPDLALASDAETQAMAAELADRFKTSLVTIRADLAALAADGALVRTRGGALPLRDEEEVPIHLRHIHLIHFHIRR